ncbi:MAG TPA: M28 family peptidase, partial [Gemmatimonadales bacterium]|nr:M28 family peptidase [Gemmatimonadales bacterium]
MMGRDTPSPGLDKTAQYIADQFSRFGLKPAGENGTWFQRYTIARRKLDPATSRVTFRVGADQVVVRLSRDASLTFGGVPSRELTTAAVLLGGAFTPDDAARLDARDKVAILVLDYSHPLPAGTVPAVQALIAGGAAGIVILSNRDSAAFAQRVAGQARERTEVERMGTAPPVVEVKEGAVAAVLAAAGVRADEIRGQSDPVSRALPELKVTFGLKEQVLSSVTAPNTVGLLEGSDPKLRKEYVVFSAHMDHVGVAGPNGTGGCRARGADSICNGADDDGSGTVGVVELAQAFTQPAARPRRSILFLTVSGEEKGLFGSSYFTEHPTVPLPQVVADLNIDMIGRNWKDTIVAIGKEHSDLGATLNRVAAAHPELDMAAIDDRWPDENFYFRSDHFNFARKGVPILFFFNGVHPDYHEVS